MAGDDAYIGKEEPIPCLQHFLDMFRQQDFSILYGLASPRTRSVWPSGCAVRDVA